MGETRRQAQGSRTNSGNPETISSTGEKKPPNESFAAYNKGPGKGQPIQTENFPTLTNALQSRTPDLRTIWGTPPTPGKASYGGARELGLGQLGETHGWVFGITTLAGHASYTASAQCQSGSFRVL